MSKRITATTSFPLDRFIGCLFSVEWSDVHPSDSGADRSAGAIAAQAGAACSFANHLKIGTDAQFAAVRRLLGQANFTEAAVLGRYGIEAYAELTPEASLPNDGGTESLLVRLFIEGLPVSQDSIATQLSPGAIADFDSLGLLRHDSPAPSQVTATVALYPIRGLLLASDRWTMPGRTQFTPRADIVYSALVLNAQEFLDYLPGEPCTSLLDVCAGSGIAALIGAHSFAVHATAIDIADRSTQFANFNARLNGIENFEALTGDLYDPVRGRIFDQIVAHPPYVAATEPDFVFRDGGWDGEEILMRLVQGCGEHLAPGGLLYLMATASDRDNERYEQRVRRWLGDWGSEFDVLLVPVRSIDPEAVAIYSTRQARDPVSASRELHRRFTDLKIQLFVHAMLIVRRRTEAREPFTIRRQKGPETAWADIRALLEWEGASTGRILQAKARANPECELRIHHQLTQEGWNPDRHVLHTLHPFSMEANTDPWGPYLLSVCDGSQTVFDLFRKLQLGDVLPQEADPHEFAQAVAILVSGGFLFLKASNPGTELP